MPRQPYKEKRDKVTVYLAPDSRKALARIARARGESQSDTLNRLIREALRRLRDGP